MKSILEDLNVVSVVVTFNRKRLLLKSIESIIAQTVKPKFIVIIDNCSSD